MPQVAVRVEFGVLFVRAERTSGILRPHDLQLHGRHLCEMGGETSKNPPGQTKLEELLKDAEEKFGTSELSATEAERHRRVSGQLVWAALSRADLAFPVGFLSRFQSKPYVFVFAAG